ncbi:MAG: carboxypeptidase-like regulatory domain-containing protein [Acidimicrobiales bacterium]
MSRLRVYGIAAMMLVVSVIAALVLIGGPPANVPTLPSPPTTLTQSVATTTPDYGGIGLGNVLPGRTSPPNVVLGPGRAALVGTVVGPTAGGGSGPVPGATVEVVRFVGSSTATARVATAANGTWMVNNIVGGRYRVRAWLAPSLTLTTPQDVYVVDGHPMVVNMTLTQFSGPSVSAAIGPNPAVSGEPASLVVAATTQVVDGAGIVRSSPQPNVTADLLGSGQWTITSANPVLTNLAGQATWDLTCNAAGPQPLEVSINGGPPQNLSLPDCATAPITTTTTTPAGSSTTPTTLLVTTTTTHG